MTRAQKTTAWVIVGLIVAAVVYNVFALTEPSPDDAISHVILRWATDHMVVPWALGAVTGHWVWPWDYPSEKWKKNAGFLLLILTGLVLALDVVGPRLSVHPMLAFVPGFAAGHLLWPQLPRHK